VDAGDGPDQDPEVIAVGETAPADDDDGADADRPRAPRSVTSVEDVTAAVDVLDSSIPPGSPESGTTAVCVDSVGRLIEERSLEGAFGLLYTVSRLLQDAGVTAHYHLSTAPYDQETVGTVAQVFDLVVTANDGEYRLQRNLEWPSASTGAGD